MMGTQISADGNMLLAILNAFLSCLIAVSLGFCSLLFSPTERTTFSTIGCELSQNGFNVPEIGTWVAFYLKIWVFESRDSGEVGISYDQPLF